LERQPVCVAKHPSFKISAVTFQFTTSANNLKWAPNNHSEGSTNMNNLVVAEFIENLAPKVKDTLQGTAKLVIKGEGSVMLDNKGARAGDDEADVTLIAPEAVFRAILDGSQNAAMAFLSGKLKVDGSNMRAIKVSEILIA